MKQNETDRLGSTEDLTKNPGDFLKFDLGLQEISISVYWHDFELSSNFRLNVKIHIDTSRSVRDVQISLIQSLGHRLLLIFLGVCFKTLDENESNIFWK